MRVTYTPQSLYGTALARGEPRYMGWLMDFSRSAQLNTGVNPITNLALGARLRRLFLAGVSPYDAVKRWQHNGW